MTEKRHVKVFRVVGCRLIRGKRKKNEAEWWACEWFESEADALRVAIDKENKRHTEMIYELEGMLRSAGSGNYNESELLRLSKQLGEIGDVGR